MEKYYKNNAYDAYDGYDTFSKGVTGLNAQLLLEQRVLVCITERALGVRTAEQYSAMVAAALCGRGRRKSRPLLPFPLMGGLGDFHRGIVFEGALRSFSGWAEWASYRSGFWD